MAIARMRGAAREDGCMAAATSSSLLPLVTPFIHGPFGPVGFVNPITGALARPLTAVAIAGGGPASQTSESRAFANPLAGLDGSGNAAGPAWVILLTTAALLLALGALLREARRSV
jgi:hypothetical protein